MPRYVVLLFLIIPLVTSAEIYKWTDANGRTHYGDRQTAQPDIDRIKVDIRSNDQVSFGNLGADKKTDSKQVTMYATSWCPYCKQARTYFNANKIAFVEYDIEQDEEAKKNYDSIGGQGVPVITVGDAKLNGFSVSAFRKIYN